MDQILGSLRNSLSYLERAQQKDFHKQWPIGQLSQSRHHSANPYPADGISSERSYSGVPPEIMESQGLRSSGLPRLPLALSKAPRPSLRPPPPGSCVLGLGLCSCQLAILRPLASRPFSGCLSFERDILLLSKVLSFFPWLWF
ncbi:hypothetical protein OIU78_029192 [Salix suchowensis]|nr:hypothetical protein OIU78_029192 [Salix suchowensis]